MKKIYIIGIVLALVFSITGCGIRETKNADKQESTVSTETKRQIGRASCRERVYAEV